MTLNEKLKLLRKEKNLSQQVASTQIGIAISSLTNYEKDRIPHMEQLKKIAKFYNVSYDYLLNDDCETL